MRNQHKLLALAISIAATAHVKQTDKGGKAYILHPLRLMMRLRTDDAELMQIAVLHDVMEDTPITYNDLVDHGFSSRVVYALCKLTHEPHKSYDDYIHGIATCKDATLVKIEDLRDNSDITRLKGVTEKDIVRMAKYHKAYLFLKKALEDVQ